MKKILLLVALVALTPLFAYAQPPAPGLQTPVILPNTTGQIKNDKRYWIYLPPDYVNDGSKHYTAVIYLHGQGEQGNESEMSKVINAANTPPNIVPGTPMPFILISPHLPKEQGGWYYTYIEKMISEAKKYNVDVNNIYVVGYSLGGGGVLQSSFTPTTIAHLKGLVSVAASSSSPANACNIRADQRLWAFHGDADGPPPNGTLLINTTAMIDAIEQCAVQPEELKETIYAGLGHGIQSRVFSTGNTYHVPNVFQWIMDSNPRTPKSTLPQNSYTLTLPSNSLSIPGTAVADTGRSISSYKWTKIRGPQVTIQGADSAKVSLQNMVAGTYEFIFQATDNAGWPSTPDLVTITVLDGPANQLPIVNAGADKILNSYSGVFETTLTATEADNDGSIVSRAWTKVSGPDATLSNAGATTLSVSNMTPGQYVFRFTATDNLGGQSSDDVLVTANAKPTANAGPDQRITLPVNSLQITGSGTDSDGTVTVYEWTQHTGPSTATLTNANTPTVSISNLIGGVYQFKLITRDNQGGWERDYVTVVVNQPPVANAGPDQSFLLPQNSITLNGTATDDNGVIRTYTWTKVSGGAATLTNANTANLTITDLVQGSYTFRLVVTDSYWEPSTGDDVVVTVLPPTAIPVVNAGADKISNSSSGNYTATLYGSASDPDGTIASYTWTKVSGEAATLTNSNTSTLSVTGMTPGQYVFRLTATDNLGATGFDDVMVTANAQPTVNAGPDQRITLPTTSLSISGTGADTDGTIVTYSWEQHSGPNTATFTNANTPTVNISGLVGGAYSFKLIVTDNNGGWQRDYVSVVVNVPPVANAGADQNLILPTNSVTLNGSGSDPDGTLIRTYAWTKVAGGTASLSGAASANLTASNLVAGSYTFRLVVTDNYWDPSVGDDVVVNVSSSGRISVSDQTVDNLNFHQLETTGTCEDCTVVLYNFQGAQCYSGKYDLAEMRKSSGTNQLILYAVYRDTVRIKTGKVVFRD